MYVRLMPLRPSFINGSTLHVDSPWGHEGTRVGPNLVIHADKAAGVTHATSLAEFTGGYPFRVTYVPSTWAESQEIVQRAWKMVGTPYNSVGLNGGLNCEQQANYAQRGEAVSPTLRGLAGVAVIAALWGLSE